MDEGRTGAHGKEWLKARGGEEKRSGLCKGVGGKKVKTKPPWRGGLPEEAKVGPRTARS